MTSLRAALATLLLSASGAWAGGTGETASAPDAADAAEWIEPALGWRPNCVASLSELASEAEKSGHAPEAFDAGILLLAGDGRLVAEGATVRLETALCAGLGGNPELVRQRIEEFGDRSFHGAVALHFIRNGCRVSAADRSGAAEDIAFEVATILALGDGMTEDAMAEIRRRVEEVLDNPGPAYEIDGGSGDLVRLPCSP